MSWWCSRAPSYFRALGQGQQYGLSARGLAIDTVGAPPGQTEEFPRFTEFWLVRPEPGATQITVYALLDSPRATGAYRFDIRPGPQTTTTVRSRVFVRAGGHTRTIATLGIAPLTSMFFFGENQPRKDDFRPEVHDSDGLMVATGEGEWLWRPLQNPRQTLVTSFATRNPRGFGLMQRDRQWSNYEDVEARYERRPECLGAPAARLGRWPRGTGAAQHPRRNARQHRGVLGARPDAPPGQPLEFAYELSWQGDEQQRPPRAWATQSRRGMGYTKAASCRGACASRCSTWSISTARPSRPCPPTPAVKAVVTSDANGQVLENIVYRNPATEPVAHDRSRTAPAGRPARSSCALFSNTTTTL